MTEKASKKLDKGFSIAYKAGIYLIGIIVTIIASNINKKLEDISNIKIEIAETKMLTRGHGIRIDKIEKIVFKPIK